MSPLCRHCHSTVTIKRFGLFSLAAAKFAACGRQCCPSRKSGRGFDGCRQRVIGVDPVDDNVSLAQLKSLFQFGLKVGLGRFCPVAAAARGVRRRRNVIAFHPYRGSSTCHRDGESHSADGMFTRVQRQDLCGKGFAVLARLTPFGGRCCGRPVAARTTAAVAETHLDFEFVSVTRSEFETPATRRDATSISLSCAVE